ncbi:hypothetical protein ACVGOW_32580 [Pseudonocardia saturnea]
MRRLRLSGRDKSPSDTTTGSLTPTPRERPRSPSGWPPAPGAGDRALIDADGLFDGAVLAPGQRAESLRLVHQVFDMLTVKNDHLLAYARRVTAGGAVPRPASALRMLPTAAPTAPPTTAAPPCPDQRPVADRLRARVEELAAHPFPAWIFGGAGAGGPVSPPHGPDQRLVDYTEEPDSPTARALPLLAGWGADDADVDPTRS